MYIQLISLSAEFLDQPRIYYLGLDKAKIFKWKLTASPSDILNTFNFQQKNKFNKVVKGIYLWNEILLKVFKIKRNEN